MRLNWRTAVTFVLACIAATACRERATLAQFDMPGSNPAALVTPRGDREVVYVEPGVSAVDESASRPQHVDTGPTRAAGRTGRLVHQRLGEPDIHPISPAGDIVDLRGENQPLFAMLGDGARVVVYPVRLGGSGHHTVGELRAQISRDGGRTWSAPRRVDGDTAPRSHNFADLALLRTGEIMLSWLDSRAGKQGVQAAVLRPDLTVARTETADPLTCQCCRTALLTGSDGDVWLAYRDLAEGNIRNMVYAVSRGGREPFAGRGDVADDRWSVKGCPESGPRFAQTSDGAVWLTWFNGATNGIETAVARADRKFIRHTGLAIRGGNHPDLGTLPDGRLIVVYETFRNTSRAIEARVSDAAHTRWEKPVTLAADGTSPHYARRGKIALLSYTSVAGGTPRVRVVDPLPMVQERSRR